VNEEDARITNEEGHADLIAGDRACDEKKVKDACIVRMQKHVYCEMAFI